MAIIKCKMCGGDLEITEGVTVAECEYCGTKQTVPSADSEKKTSLFLRANKLRFDCDFDRAAGIYDSIITDFPAEPEAYWGLLLCKYGIEYVDDPATGTKVPTCHRSSYDSVLEDENLEKVMEYADAVARKVYRDEAKAIEEIRKGILEVSGKEPPYDIFICYKETDENGERTVDSVLAQDVYDALTEKGYRVFFSRITLEDKLGTEYEPYIFAALNSAKVMLVFGTDYEYFNAVWVKNEWSRYLKLMAQDKSKHLIPCYKDVDAYDMPKEFQKLQGQDMGKVGAVQDLLRGIDKLLGKGQAAKTAAPDQAPGGPTMESLLKRGQIFLGDENWNGANEYFDKVLDMDPECAEAYVGKLCVEMKCASEKMLKELPDDIAQSGNYQKAIRFSDPKGKAQLEQYRQAALECQTEARAKLQSNKVKIHKAAGCIAAEGYYTVGLRSDGTVVAVGDKHKGLCEVLGWTDIVAVKAGHDHTVGLRSDGTVVAAGYNGDGQCNVSDWTDIVVVAAGPFYTVGLRSDGTVAAAGENKEGQCNVSDWIDVVAVAAGNEHTVGLRSDGTVVAVGNNKDGQCNVSDWTDIVAITAGWHHTVGLRSNGTVVAVGKGENGQCDVSKWRDIVAVAAGEDFTAGLRADGTVAAVGKNEYGQCNVSDWTDIVAITAGWHHTVGLRSDGTVVAVGKNDAGQCNVLDWKLFNSLDTLEEEQAKARRKEEAAHRKQQGRKKKIQKGQKVDDTQDRQLQIQRLEKRRAEIAPAKYLINVKDWLGGYLVCGMRQDGSWYIEGRPRDKEEFDQLLEGRKDLAQLGVIEHTRFVGLHLDGRVLEVSRAEQYAKASPSDNRKILVGKYNEKIIYPCGSAAQLIPGPANTNIDFAAIQENGTIFINLGTKRDYPGVFPSYYSENLGWKDIKSVGYAEGLINYKQSVALVGVKTDGTVIITDALGSRKFNDPLCYSAEHRPENWRDIIKVECSRGQIYGLQRDGYIKATMYEVPEIQNWTDIVDFCVEFSTYPLFVGLKEDGTVVTAERVDARETIVLSEQGKKKADWLTKVDSWTDIVAIFIEHHIIVGVKSDGTVVYSSSANRDLSPLSEWKLFDDLNSLKKSQEERRVQAFEEYKRREARKQELLKEAADLQNERSTLLSSILKSVFTGKRQKEIQTRLAEIEAELKNL